MTTTKRRIGSMALLVIVTGALAGPPAQANGFQIFEQGTRALGTANAVAAGIDDPSAIFYNMGGLAFQADERRFMLGGTLIQLGDSEFFGAEPFPGEGVTEEQNQKVLLVPHGYWTEPIRKRDGAGDLVFGLGVTAPFGLETEWENDRGFSGRFISTRAELVAIDLNATVGYRVTDNLGIGVSLIGRGSVVELESLTPAVNPFTQVAVDVADVQLDSDVEFGFGGAIGIQHRINEYVSWGAVYRSEIEVEYDGDAFFEQIPTGDPLFDAQVAGLIPFGSDRPIETEIDFPATATFGVEFQILEKVRWHTDINWTGWSSFDTTTIEFLRDGDPDDSVIVSEWKDAYTYRTGFTIDGGGRNIFRVGYYFDETPQPDEAVGPLLPDADRNGFTFGYGRRGDEIQWDLAFLYLPFEDRTTLTNSDNFNGRYETTTLLLGGSVMW